MKIAGVEAVQLRLSSVKDIFDGTQDVLVVRVRSDEGAVGYGEVVSSSYVARAVIEAPRSGGGRHGLAEIVRGMDPMDGEGVWEAMYEATSWYGRRGVAIHAMAGIDLALWDLRGRIQGEPVFRMISSEAAPPPRVKAYASLLWGDTPDETRALVSRVLDHGFRAVKFGFGPRDVTLEQDLERIRAAQEVLEPRGGELMVDVGRRWTADEAIERIGAMEELERPPLWVEEPLPPDDLEGYAKLCEAVSIPVASAETEELPEQFRLFMDAGVKVVQPDLGRVGLTQALQIGRMAEERDVRCVPHCFGTGINTTAAIHWMAGTGRDLTEYPMRTNALCRDLARGLPGLEAGFVAPGDEPGFGLDLDPAVVEEYAYAG